MTPSHGLAFCALVHKYHPEMINFTSLSKDNCLKNNQIAFDAAEKLGVPALLEAEDMLVEPKPDQFSVMTYPRNPGMGIANITVEGGNTTNNPTPSKNSPRNSTVIPANAQPAPSAKPAPTSTHQRSNSNNSSASLPKPNASATPTKPINVQIPPNNAKNPAVLASSSTPTRTGITLNPPSAPNRNSGQFGNHPQRVVEDKSEVNLQINTQSHPQQPHPDEDSCAKCGKPLEGEVIEALEKAFHQKCFGCHKCGRALKAKFVPVDGWPYCEGCGRQAFVTSRLQRRSQAPSDFGNNASNIHHAEQARGGRDQAERERAELDRAERERKLQAERDKQEKDRIAKEREEKERQQKVERDRREHEEKEAKEKQELDRRQREKAEIEHKEKERKEKQEHERLTKEKQEQERLAKEKADKEHKEKERLEKERKEKQEHDRLAKEKADKDKAEKERKEKQEQDKSAKEKVDKERLEKERQEKADKERLEKERQEKADKERLEKERQEKAQRDKDENDRLRKDREDKLQKERELAEKVEKDREEAKKQREQLESEKQKERPKTVVLTLTVPKKEEGNRDSGKIDRASGTFATVMTPVSPSPQTTPIQVELTAPSTTPKPSTPASVTPQSFTEPNPNRKSTYIQEHIKQQKLQKEKEKKEAEEKEEAIRRDKQRLDEDKRKVQEDKEKEDRARREREERERKEREQKDKEQRAHQAEEDRKEKLRHEKEEKERREREERERKSKEEREIKEREEARKEKERKAKDDEDRREADRKAKEEADIEKRKREEVGRGAKEELRESGKKPSPKTPPLKREQNFVIDVKKELPPIPTLSLNKPLPPPPAETVPTIDTEKVLMEGFLLKQQAAGLVRLWQQRYFILYAEKLVYFRSHMKPNTPPHGIFQIRLMHNIENLPGSRFAIHIEDKVWNMEAETEDEKDILLNNWFSSINNACKNLEPVPVPVLSKTSNDKIKRKEGWLNKLGFFGFSKVWVVLRGGVISYSETQGGKQQGRVLLYKCKLEEYDPKHKKACFMATPLHESSTLNIFNWSTGIVFQAKDEMEMHEWLNEVVKQKVMIEDTIDNFQMDE